MYIGGKHQFPIIVSMSNVEGGGYVNFRLVWGVFAHCWAGSLDSTIVHALVMGPLVTCPSVRLSGQV